jgi:hypothetical protein
LWLNRIHSAQTDWQPPRASAPPEITGRAQLMAEVL